MTGSADSLHNVIGALWGAAHYAFGYNPLILNKIALPGEAGNFGCGSFALGAGRDRNICMMRRLLIKADLAANARDLDGPGLSIPEKAVAAAEDHIRLARTPHDKKRALIPPSAHGKVPGIALSSASGDRPDGTPIAGFCHLIPQRTDVVEKVGHLSAAAGWRIWRIAARLLMRP